NTSTFWPSVAVCSVTGAAPLGAPMSRFGLAAEIPAQTPRGRDQRPAERVYHTLSLELDAGMKRLALLFFGDFAGRVFDHPGSAPDVLGAVNRNVERVDYIKCVGHVLRSIKCGAGTLNTVCCVSRRYYCSETHFASVTDRHHFRAASIVR